MDELGQTTVVYAKQRHVTRGVVKLLFLEPLSR